MQITCALRHHGGWMVVTWSMVICFRVPNAILGRKCSDGVLSKMECIYIDLALVYFYKQVN